MIMKLWIDDVRTAPEGYIWIKTVAMTIQFIEQVDIAFNKKIKEDPRVDNTILPIRDGINVIYKL